MIYVDINGILEVHRSARFVEREAMGVEGFLKHQLDSTSMAWRIGYAKSSG